MAQHKWPRLSVTQSGYRPSRLFPMPDGVKHKSVSVQEDAEENAGLVYTLFDRNNQEICTIFHMKHNPYLEAATPAEDVQSAEWLYLYKQKALYLVDAQRIIAEIPVDTENRPDPVAAQELGFVLKS